MVAQNSRDTCTHVNGIYPSLLFRCGHVRALRLHKTPLNYVQDGLWSGFVWCSTPELTSMRFATTGENRGTVTRNAYEYWMWYSLIIFCFSNSDGIPWYTRTPFVRLSAFDVLVLLATQTCHNTFVFRRELMVVALQYGFSGVIPSLEFYSHDTGYRCKYLPLASASLHIVHTHPILFRNNGLTEIQTSSPWILGQRGDRRRGQATP